MRKVAFGALLGLTVAACQAAPATAQPDQSSQSQGDNRRVRVMVDVTEMPAYTYEVAPDSPSYGKVPGNDSLASVDGVQCETRNNRIVCSVSYGDNRAFFSELEQVCATSARLDLSAIGADGSLIGSRPHTCVPLQNGRATLEFRVGEYMQSGRDPTIFYLRRDNTYAGVVWGDRDFWDNHSQLLAAL